MQHAQQILQQLQPQLEQAKDGAEQILLEAISKQSWYTFKNKPQLVFHTKSGFLFPNIRECNSFITCKQWKSENFQSQFSIYNIAKGEWKALHDSFYRAHNGPYRGFLNRDKFDYTYAESSFDYPLKFRSLTPSNVLYYTDAYPSSSNYYYYLSPDNKKEYYSSEYEKSHFCILPYTHILDNDLLLPQNYILSPIDKAKIILDFFLEQDWTPIFDDYIEQYEDEEDEDFKIRLKESQTKCDRYNRLFGAYYKRIQLQKQLVEIEQQLAGLPEPAQTWLSADFNYRPVLAQYPLTEIAQSVWQYSQSAQHWLNTLLEQLDEWESEHSDVITTAQSINAIFAEKLQLSSQLNEQECAVLNEHHQYLKQKLNFSLIPTKQKLIALLEQNQQLEQKLEQTDDLQSLAELEQYSRPSFPLLAEHSATLCTKNLASLEWLEQNLTFIQDVVASAEQQREQYLIFVDKYQQDLLKEASDNSIEDEHIQKWLTEWRTERLTLLQQWLPLVKAGLQHELTQETVRSTLACLVNYQEQIDQFYLKSRLGVHTKFAFTANGHRQEQLEKDSELIKLNHQFMQALQTVIFSLSNSREKLWLLNYSEVWQKHIVQEIQVFLQNENLLERDDIAQLMMDDMRKVQQQSLASCLQDAERYSEALEQRNKSVNTLIFKMRKALSAEK